MNKLYKYFTPETFKLNELVNNFCKEVLADKKLEIPDDQKEKVEKELRSKIRIAAYLSGRVVIKDMKVEKPKTEKLKTYKEYAEKDKGILPMAEQIKKSEQSEKFDRDRRKEVRKQSQSDLRAKFA